MQSKVINESALVVLTGLCGGMVPILHCVCVCSPLYNVSDENYKTGATILGNTVDRGHIVTHIVHNITDYNTCYIRHYHTHYRRYQRRFLQIVYIAVDYNQWYIADYYISCIH